ncbi:unnamed protein product [marine sediment metagenome]|uniref:Amidoligase enzyme n=1 Tax=marine sediment metagenome TaxID=412755 RepID=X0T4R0_9ZZZZ
MTKNIGIGMEVECVLNKSIHSFPVGGYHNGIKVKGLSGWKAERDGSLRGYEFESNTKHVELVSSISHTTESFQSVVSRFIKFMSKNKRYELNEVLVFNDSMGSHVHVSIDGFNFEKKVIYDVFTKARDFFIDKIRKSNIQSKEEIISQYTRDYSKATTPSRFRNSEREQEWNFQSERRGNGLEWRSPNMTGIKTWDEFRTFMRITLQTLKFLIENAQKYSKKNVVNFTEAAKDNTTEINEEIIIENNHSEINEEIIARELN